MKDKLSTIRLIIRPKACLRELDAINHVDGDMRNATQYRLRKQRLSQLEDVLRMQKKYRECRRFFDTIARHPPPPSMVSGKNGSVECATADFPPTFLRLFADRRIDIRMERRHPLDS